LEIQDIIKIDLDLIPSKGRDDGKARAHSLATLEDAFDLALGDAPAGSSAAELHSFDATSPQPDTNRLFFDLQPIGDFLNRKVLIGHAKIIHACASLCLFMLELPL